MEDSFQAALAQQWSQVDHRDRQELRRIEPEVPKVAKPRRTKNRVMFRGVEEPQLELPEVKKEVSQGELFPIVDPESSQDCTTLETAGSGVSAAIWKKRFSLSTILRSFPRQRNLRRSSSTTIVKTLRGPNHAK
jgi:hypothetical protein